MNEDELRSLLERRVDAMETVHERLCISHVSGLALQEADDEMDTCVQMMHVVLLRG